MTKILVGVGLTQIGKIGEFLERIGTAVGPGLGGTASSSIYGIALTIYFTICGFLLAYLWTRLFLGRKLSDAERVQDLKQQLSALEAQAQSDAQALLLASQQLNGSSEALSQEDLNVAIAAASQDTRSNIFFRAQSQRWKNWKEKVTKPIMARTIPVFRALIASDTGDRYHANHGQLGYALKDQENPDWQGAEQALTRAIAIRGDARIADEHGYEGNRALCQVMMLDAEFRKDSSDSAWEAGSLGRTLGDNRGQQGTGHLNKEGFWGTRHPGGWTTWASSPGSKRQRQFADDDHST